MRSHRRKRRSAFVWQPWMTFAAVGCVIIGGALCIPRVRAELANGGNAVRQQAIADFGVPETDSRVLVIRLLDNSGSSDKIKKTINAQTSVVSNIPGVSAQTYIWRYADKEELIYAGVNQDRFVKPALLEYYQNVSAPTTPGTNLGRALEAVEKVVLAWRQMNPKSIVVLTIGTDGGVEDPDKACEVAKRLVGDNVYCLVHGTLVEQRLREQITNTLRPLKAAHRLVVCNEKDFTQALGRFSEIVDQAIKQQGIAHKAQAN